MTELFSQYASGIQFSAGTIVGSSTGASGLNPIVDRLNSISTDNNLITGSMVSGTSLEVYASGGNMFNNDLVNDYDEGTSQTFGTNGYVNYTNGSIVLTTTGGPVFINISTNFLFNNWQTGLSSADYRIDRDATAQSQNHSIATGSIALTGRIPASICWIDTPSAGTHTYHLQVSKLFGSPSIEHANLAGFELRN